jgi:hypothetical protein
MKYKDHPALLVWALGNEMEDPEGKNGAVWTAINSLAVMVKQLDPKHPTMTVVAEIGGDKVKNIHRLCPEIDIIGINTYGGATSVGERYKKLGGTKPYLLTEYGPAGIWEVKKDALGAYPEPTSTEKAETYRQHLQDCRSRPTGSLSRKLCLSLGPEAGSDGNMVQPFPAGWSAVGRSRCLVRTLERQTSSQPMPDSSISAGGRGSGAWSLARLCALRSGLPIQRRIR